MADPKAPPPSTEESPLGPPYEYVGVRAYPRPCADTVYGFILDEQSRLRWARWYYEMAYPGKLLTMTPEETDRVLTFAERTMRSMLHGLIYHEFPDLPRLRNRLLPVKTRPSHKIYVFTLADDATPQGFLVHLDTELIKKVGRRLGLGDQEPRWYRIEPSVRTVSLSCDLYLQAHSSRGSW